MEGEPGTRGAAAAAGSRLERERGAGRLSVPWGAESGSSRGLRGGRGGAGREGP